MAKPKVEIDGLKELRKEIRKIGDETLTEAMREANIAVANLVLPTAKTKSPKNTGALASTLRITKTVNYSAIRAGNGRAVPYAGVIEYGWPARGIKASKFIAGAISDQYRKIIKTYEQAIEEIGRQLSS